MMPKTYPRRVPTAASDEQAVWAGLYAATLHRLADSFHISYSLDKNTSASQQSILREARPYTEEELRMFAEADRYTPELHEQVRAFLEM